MSLKRNLQLPGRASLSPTCDLQKASYKRPTPVGETSSSSYCTPQEPTLEHQLTECQQQLAQAREEIQYLKDFILAKGLQLPEYPVHGHGQWSQSHATPGDYQASPQPTLATSPTAPQCITAPNSPGLLSPLRAYTFSKTEPPQPMVMSPNSELHDNPVVLGQTSTPLYHPTTRPTTCSPDIAAMVARANQLSEIAARINAEPTHTYVRRLPVTTVVKSPTLHEGERWLA
eukprot:TRINITY_DN67337_c2_g4_i1.p1 TRINITY_DN67337_c2_g4~~TRINITY_DN67337_c2_g4_i1.p1  ORF type:complete len:230 (-),score=10.07 TRINITY_DN67337_c2_g4_i1:215-904(-)